MMQYMLNHLAVKVGDVTTATQMVRVVVELHLLVCIAFLEVVLRCSWHNTCLSSLQAAVIAAEALTIDIVVVVLAIVRHSKGCIIIINDLQLPCIFSFIINIQAVSFITYIQNGNHFKNIFLILQMGLIVLVMNVSKHLWPSKYHLLPSQHLEEPPIACAMIHSLS